jgi:membrane-associated phospholipid phosphatase
VAANPMNQPGQGTELAPARSDGHSGRPRLAAPGRVLAGLVCLALAAALITVVARAPSSVRPADHQWLRWMLDIRTPPGVFVAKVLNVVAGGTVMWIVRAAIAAALAIGRRWRVLVMFAAAELCAELCIGPVKALVDRPRPAGSLVAVTGQSMPSGHALTAAVTAVALALIVTRPGRSRRPAIAAAAAWAVLVALSRTYLSAHWLTDVVAGLLLGTGWAALWFGALAPSRPDPGGETVGSLRLRVRRGLGHQDDLSALGPQLSSQPPPAG